MNSPRVSLNYIGSKLRLLPFISETIINIVGDTTAFTFAEPFAGTGVVARHFKSKVRHVIVNDIEPYSFVLNRNYIGNHIPFEYQSLLAELNNLHGVEGQIYQNYCLGGNHGRQYFSDENGKKIDGIRQKIAEWRTDEKVYYFLLASLLESADRVANVASVYGAFLKRLKRTAQKPLFLEPALFEANEHDHEIYNIDANALMRQISGDILYLDPPYNARQYGANYHLLNTIALYDEFVPRGKTGLRDYARSPYCQQHKVATVFEDLIAHAQFRYIFLSYNNEGLMSAAEVKSIMSKYGDYSLKKTDYQRFKADKDSNRQHKACQTEEYLHILVKG